jgi:heme exporter protein C
MWTLIANLISPKKFYRLSTYLLPWLSIAFVMLFAYGLVGGLWLAPADQVQGDAFRIIYVHVPCAILSLFIYLVITIAAILANVFNIKLCHLIIKHSLKLGASFTLLALITGSIWGKPMWGTWWIWDARLTSELILLFIYLGLLLFQSASEEKKSGARALNILIMVGFIDIPIIHYSVYWWNTLHQGSSLHLLSPTTIAATMLYPLLAMISAFMVYYAIVILMLVRGELAKNNQHWRE